MRNLSAGALTAAKAKLGSRRDAVSSQGGEDEAESRAGENTWGGREYRFIFFVAEAKGEHKLVAI